MNRNYGLCGTRSSGRTVFRQPVGSVRQSVAFVGPAISCQDGRSTYGPLGLPATVGIMTLITRQCFAIPTSSREPRDREIDKEGPTGPVGRASERQKRSDLICDRETSRLLTIAPVPSTAKSPPPSNPPPSAPFLLSHLWPFLRSAPFLSVPPLRRLPYLPLFTSLLAR